jgi:hypothetical protein
MLSPREAFKFGFMLRCADENLTEEQTRERIKVAFANMQKTAWINPFPAIGQTAKAVYPLIKGLGLLGIGGAAAAGGLGGYGLAKMTEKDVDPEEIKRQELIAAYQQQANEIRRRAKARSYRPSKAPRAPQLVA